MEPVDIEDKGIFKETAGKPGEISGMISFGGPPPPIMDSWINYISTVDLTTTGLQKIKEYVPAEGTQFRAGGEFEGIRTPPTPIQSGGDGGEFSMDEAIQIEKLKQAEEKTKQQEINQNYIDNIIKCVRERKR